MRLALVTALALLAACTAPVRIPTDAWRSVPAHCAVEYDARGAIVASYCKVES